MSYGHLERRPQRVGGGHLAPDQGLELLALPRRDLEHELVVHLEQHPRGQPLSAQRAVDAQHRDLDDVGGGTLDRRVERHPLGHLATLPVVGGEVGQVAPATHDRLGVARCAWPRRRRTTGSRARRRSG